MSSAAFTHNLCVPLSSSKLSARLSALLAFSSFQK
jgi:hypothetical protein